MSHPEPDKARRNQLRKNSLRRLLARVPRHSGAIMPAVPDDRYRSLLSLYRFAGRQVKARSVVDLSCGTGFGCHEMLRAGATSVLGIEKQDWAVRHARRNYKATGLSFREATLADLPPDLGRFGAAVGWNVLPRYGDVEQLLKELCAHLEDDAVLVVSVPVIKDEETLLRARAQGAGGLVSHFYPWYWEAILDSFFSDISCFRHLPPRGHAPDFNSPFPSRLDADAFEFEPVRPDELRVGVSIAAVFVARGLARARRAK